MWTDEELKELEEDEDQWDWEHATVHEPVKDRRVDLTVDLSVADFRAAAAAARRDGITTIEFVRQATREKANATLGLPTGALD